MRLALLIAGFAGFLCFPSPNAPGRSLLTRYSEFAVFPHRLTSYKTNCYFAYIFIKSFQPVRFGFFHLY